MPYDIGPKIGIDGEAQFRKEIQQISENIKTLGSELKVVASAADLEGDSIENLSSQNEILNKTIGELEKRLEAQRKMLDQATSKYGEADTKTQKWQRTVNATETELNKLRSQVSKNEKEIDSLGDATDDAGDAMEDLGSAADSSGGKLDTMTVAIGNLVASGIQAAIEGVMNLASEIWNLDEATEEYRRAQGRLNTAYEAAGLGADAAQQAYTGFYAILGDTDTATEASQLLAQLAENEEELAEWTQIAAGVSGTFGDALPIEGLIEAANETARVGEVTGSLADALNWVGISEDDFNAKLAECSDESERNRLIMETLAGQYDEASEAFYRNNEALIAARNAQAQMDAVMGQLGGTISTLKTQLTAELTPALAGVASAFNSLLQGEDGSTEAFAQFIQALIAQVTEMLPSLIEGGVQILTAIVTGLLQAEPDLIAAAPEIIGSFVTALGENLPQVLEAGVELLNQLVTGIEQGLPDMIARIPEIITQFLDYITSQLPAILDQGVEMLNSLTDGIINGITTLVQNLPQVITAFLTFIAENLPEIVNAGIEILANLVEGIITAIPELVAALPQIITAIVEGIGALMSSIINIGADIVRGIWQGIQNMASWIKDKVTGFFSGIVNSVKNFLGIASPSKVFANMGGNMALGLEEGFAGEMRAVERSINRSMAGLIPSVSGTVSVTGAAASGSVPAAVDFAGAITNALSGAVVMMDGRKVGKLITKTQNQSIRAAGLVPTI